MSDQFVQTIVIGLGGTGYQVLTHLKQNLLEVNDGRLPEEVQLLAFDTGRQQETPDIEMWDGKAKLEHQEIVSLGGDLNEYLRYLEKENKSSNTENLLFDVRRLPPTALNASAGAGRNRVLAKLALLSDLSRSQSRSRTINSLNDVLSRAASRQYVRDTTVRVFIVGSLAGATGSSWIIDFPVILQQIANRNKIILTLHAFVVLPDALFPKQLLPELEANAFSAWRELDRLMGATPERTQMLEYPGSEFNKVVLERPLYDHCYVFGEKEQNLDDKNLIYPKLADILLAFTDGNVDSCIKTREGNLSAQKYSGEDGKFYQAIGVYSVKNPLYLLKKYLAARYLLEKWYDLFRVRLTDNGISGWSPNGSTISSQQSLDIFFVEGGLSPNMRNFLTGLRDLSNQYQLKDISSSILPARELKLFFNQFITAFVDPNLTNLARAEIQLLIEMIDVTYIDKWESRIKNLKIDQNLIRRTIDLLQAERRDIFGDRTERRNKGKFQGLLSNYSASLYDKFVGLLEQHLNNIFHSENRVPEQTGEFGYVYGLLTTLEEIFYKSHEIILKQKDFMQKEKDDLRLQAWEDVARKEMVRKTEQLMIIRWFSAPKAIYTYLSAVRAENQYWVNYYMVDEIDGLLAKMTDLVRNLKGELDFVSKRFFLGQDNLLLRIKQESDLSLAQYKERASTYLLESEDASSEVNMWLEILRKQTTKDFPLIWDIKKRESTSPNGKAMIKLKFEFSKSRMNPSLFKQKDPEDQEDFFNNIRSWSNETVANSLPLAEFSGGIIESENLIMGLVEKSNPWLHPQDVYFIRSRESEIEGRQSSKRRSPWSRNIENLTEVTAAKLPGLTSLQFSSVMSAGEINIFQKYQSIYYTVYRGERKHNHNPARHILAAEVNAFRYEDQIANNKPLSNLVVRLLQDERLFDLFLKALAANFINTSKNDQGEIWYQLSHPDLGHEIYLTIPETTSEDIVLKLPEALSTFILKRQDVRPRQRETEIDYSTLERALNNRWENLGSRTELRALDQFYREYLSVAQFRQKSLQNKYRNEAFGDLMTVMDIGVKRLTGISYQVGAVERKPILKVSDHYVVAIPLKSESRNLFVGRQKYFEQIENIWKNQSQKASIILYGQRRMGKTSLLYQLESKLGSSYITILLDFQGIGPQVKKESDFWRLLAKLIHRGLEERKITIEQYIDVAEIKSSENFDDYLYAIEKDLGTDKWLVLLIDEFEKIEEKIDAGIVSTDIFDSLRHIIQHRDRIIILLAGHHTLQERLKQYWNPLMETAINVKLSYLSKEEAKQLIQSPWEDFELKYVPQALERIVEVCGGQPLLIQLVCKGVINRVNQRLQENGGEVIPMATRSDVEFVLQRIVVAEDHDADTITFFFDAVWSWLKDDEKQYLIKLAGIAALENGGWIKTTDNAEILNRLVERDVLEKGDGGYRFRVDLLKQWVVDKYVK